MDDSLYSRLRETSWRRKLTPAEEAELRSWLAAHPEQQSEWERETALNELLGRLPDAPVPSNFTARILDVATGSSAGLRRRRSIWNWSWRSFLPRAAVAGVVLVLGLSFYRQHEVTRRVELAHRIANVSDMVAVPSPEALQDFDTVRRLNQTPSADEELLALLQ